MVSSTAAGPTARRRTVWSRYPPLSQFKTEDSALQAATALFHRVWPDGGGKLVTDFIDLSRMNDLISKKR